MTTKTKKEIVKKEVITAKYIKNINDYSEFTILLDDIIDPKTNNSLLDILVYGKNPNIELFKEVEKEKDKEKKDKLLLEFATKHVTLISKILRKNLRLSLAIAKQYTTEDLGNNINTALLIVNDMINEFIAFKKK